MIFFLGGGRAFFASAASTWLKYAQTSEPSVGVLKPERSAVPQTGFNLLLSVQRDVLVHPAGAEELAVRSPPLLEGEFSQRIPVSFDLPAKGVSFPTLPRSRSG